MECPHCKNVHLDAEACACGWQPNGSAASTLASPEDETEEGAEEIRRAPEATAAGTENPGVAARSSGTEVAPAPSSKGREDPPPSEAENTVTTEGNVGNVFVINGHHTRIGTGARKSAKKADRGVTLLDITSEFQPEGDHWETLDTEDAAVHARVLSEKGLLLVSCVDASLARAAVQAVVAALGPNRARLLNFDLLGGDANLTINNLLQCRCDADTDGIVVADAFSADAQSFLDSLLSARGAWSRAEVKQRLRDRGLRLVCVAEPQRYASFGGMGDEGGFTVWTVPFLQPFLRREFPDDHEELRSSILQQRADGRWSRDDAEFSQQLRTLAIQKRLRDVVESGGVPRNRAVEVDDERPVHQAVLFTGAFFTMLSVRDFGQVVATILGDTAIPISAAPAADGSPGTAELREKPLVQLWREGADRIMRECGLSVLRDPTAGNGVEFQEPGTRDALKERLECDFPYRLQDTFSALYENGLLFTGSEAVAANVIRATAHMAENDPEMYGRDWMASVLLRAAHPIPNAVLLRRILRRFAELLREISTRPAVQPLVDGVLDFFLNMGEFDIVLELVKQLRFAPQFDAFRGLRQLIDRGSAEVRGKAYRFLYREVGAAGEQVYANLHALSEWLPAEDRDTERYSPSNHLALRLLVEYASGTAAAFEPSDYGEWPTRYPLLAVSSDLVARDLGLLVRWLLHPGMAQTVRDEDGRPAMPRLLAALIAEWTFILFGSRAAPVLPDAEPADPTDDGETRERVFTALLAEVAARTRTRAGRALRREMVAYWDEMKQGLVPTPGMSRVEREEAAWKRGLFRALLLRVRALQTDPSATSNDPDVVPVTIGV